MLARKLLGRFISSLIFVTLIATVFGVLGCIWFIAGYSSAALVEGIVDNARVAQIILQILFALGLLRAAQRYL